MSRTLPQNPNDWRIYEIALLSSNGYVRPLINQLVNPEFLSSEAQLRFIERRSQVKEFDEKLYDRLACSTKNRDLIIYNAKYDWGVLKRQCEILGREMIQPKRVICAMRLFKGWTGGILFPPLPGLPQDKHSAQKDCRLVRKLLQGMAKSEAEGFDDVELTPLRWEGRKQLDE